MQLRAAFAIDAESLLAKGAANEAALLCVSGLGAYPDYLGGYILLSRAYTALERPLDATIILDEAERRFPSFVVPRRSEDVKSQSVITEKVSGVSEKHTGVNEKLTGVTKDLTGVNEKISGLDDKRSGLDDKLTFIGADSTTLQSEPLPTLRTMRVLTTETPRASTLNTSSPLRIIDTAHIVDDTRIIRAASVRLIPGLEFTTLRFEGTKTRGRREIQTLSDPPPFRRFHPARRVLTPAMPMSSVPNRSQPSKPNTKPVSLEELASRLERARMPRANELMQVAATAPPTHAVVPTSANMGLPKQQSLVTETIARIYMQQGAYEKAIDAFSALSVSRPEKSAEYQSIIAELTLKLNS